MFARESAANTWYACGALHLRHGRLDEALAAFQHALARVPGHACAAAGLALVDPAAAPLPRSAHTNVLEAAVAAAIGLVAHGRHDEAARHCGHALCVTGMASAGWRLPVEPLLRATAHPAAWASTLAVLRDRAR